MRGETALPVERRRLIFLDIINGTYGIRFFVAGTDGERGRSSLSSAPLHRPTTPSSSNHTHTTANASLRVLPPAHRQHPRRMERRFEIASLQPRPLPPASPPPPRTRNVIPSCQPVHVSDQSETTSSPLNLLPPSWPRDACELGSKPDLGLLRLASALGLRGLPRGT